MKKVLSQNRFAYLAGWPFGNVHCLTMFIFLMVSSLGPAVISRSNLWAQNQPGAERAGTHSAKATALFP